MGPRQLPAGGPTRPRGLPADNSGADEAVEGFWGGKCPPVSGNTALFPPAVCRAACERDFLIDSLLFRGRGVAFHLKSSLLQSLAVRAPSSACCAHPASPSVCSKSKKNSFFFFFSPALPSRDSRCFVPGWPSVAGCSWLASVFGDEQAPRSRSNPSSVSTRVCVHGACTRVHARPRARTRPPREHTHVREGSPGGNSGHPKRPARFPGFPSLFHVAGGAHGCPAGPGSRRVTLQCHLLTHQILGPGSRLSPSPSAPANPAPMAEGPRRRELGCTGAGPCPAEDEGGESP